MFAVLSLQRKYKLTLSLPRPTTIALHKMPPTCYEMLRPTKIAPRKTPLTGILWSATVAPRKTPRIVRTTSDSS